MYRQNDIDKLENNLDRLRDEAEKVYLDNYKEPSKKEYDNVQTVILDFIKKKDRIIYGGFAQNSLIRDKNPNDVFYSDISCADIEFYSPNPVEDTMELSNILFNKGFKYVEGKEAMHKETYKIYSEFINYCDIRYMQKNIFNNCPFIKIDGIKMVHPHFILIDTYRVYTDPMTSYWRLDKTFSRSLKLIKHYLFDEKSEYNRLSYEQSDENEDIKKFIKRNIIRKSSGMYLIVIGHYAFNYLVKKENKKNKINFTYYQLISIHLDDDFKKISLILEKKYGSDLEINEFYPFSDYFDKHYEFLVNGKIVLKLYGNYKRCILNSYSKKKRTIFGTSQLVMLYLLIDYNYALINKNSEESNNYLFLIVKLFKIRDKYLKENEITVLDNSPFQEFTLKCDGIPQDPIRSCYLEGHKKKEQGKKRKFYYNPTGKLGKVPIFQFDNSSGNKKIKN